MKATAACALPKSGEGGEPKQQIFMCSSLRMSRLTCVTAAKSLRPSTAIRLGLARLPRLQRHARKRFAPACRLKQSFAVAAPIKASMRWCGAWRDATSSSIGCGVRTAPTSSPSNRKSRITGRRQCGSAQTARWSCRGSLICGGAATIWCLSRRAPQRLKHQIESPRAAALLRIYDPNIAAVLAKLSTPQTVGQLRRLKGFPGVLFLGTLVDCRFAFTIDAKSNQDLRSAEGDDDLVLWDFHDLLFHTRSTEGRHANPLGGTFPHAGVIAPLPAVRPSWPGKSIDLRGFLPPKLQANSAFGEILRKRHSVRGFDERRPIALAELSQFL